MTVVFTVPQAGNILRGVEAVIMNAEPMPNHGAGAVREIEQAVEKADPWVFLEAHRIKARIRDIKTLTHLARPLLEGSRRNKLARMIAAIERNMAYPPDAIGMAEKYLEHMHIWGLWLKISWDDFKENAVPNNLKRFDTAHENRIFFNSVDVTYQSWIRNHAVFGEPLRPGQFPPPPQRPAPTPPGWQPNAAQIAAAAAQIAATPAALVQNLPDLF